VIYEVFMRRRRDPELMDDPQVDASEHRAALMALRRSNRVLGFDARLARAVAGVCPSNGARIIELGMGGGGLIAALRAQLNRQTCKSRLLVGLDRSPFPIGLMKTDSQVRQFESFVVGDALQLPFEDHAFDVVVCSLLLHHFDPEPAIRLLKEAARVASSAVVVGDLNRSRIAFSVTWLFTRLTSRSHVFHVDGPRSVRAAYQPNEALALAAAAGLRAAKVLTNPPFRWMLVWRREPR
jgi:SAM-dependent methyltransferase